VCVTDDARGQRTSFSPALDVSQYQFMKLEFTKDPPLYRMPPDSSARALSSSYLFRIRSSSRFLSSSIRSFSSRSRRASYSSSVSCVGSFRSGSASGERLSLSLRCFLDFFFRFRSRSRSESALDDLRFLFFLCGRSSTSELSGVAATVSERDHQFKVLANAWVSFKHSRCGTAFFFNSSSPQFEMTTGTVGLSLASTGTSTSFCTTSS
jgi:hypothetical protein